MKYGQRLKQHALIREIMVVVALCKRLAAVIGKRLI